MKIAIIGSGIVGLSLAYDLSDKSNEVVVYEKEKDSLSHGTGRNSGVIHSGIYYTPNSLRSEVFSSSFSCASIASCENDTSFSSEVFSTILSIS